MKALPYNGDKVDLEGLLAPNDVTNNHICAAPRPFSSLLVLHRYIFKVKQYYAPGTKTVGDPEYSMHINEVQTWQETCSHVCVYVIS